MHLIPGWEPQLSQDDKANFTWENCVFLIADAESFPSAANLYYCKATRSQEENFIEWGGVA